MKERQKARSSEGGACHGVVPGKGAQWGITIPCGGVR